MANRQWQTLWGYQQQDYRSWPSTIESQWQKIRIRLNHQGNQLCLTFGNLYGVEDLYFKQVSVQILNHQAQIKSQRLPVSIDGKKEIQVKAGCACLESDVVTLSYSPGDILEIRTFVSSAVTLTSGIVSYARLQQEVLNYRALNQALSFEDQLTTFRMVQENPRMFFIYGLSGVLGETEGSTLVAFGDSLTQQGFWIDHLKQRLLEEQVENVSIINRGIGGGRILHDTNPMNDTFQRHGRAGIKRFLHDVLSVNSVTGVLVSYGINDVTSTIDQESSAMLYQQLVDAYTFFAEEAKLRNLSAYITTLMPMKKSIFWTAEGERLRLQVNKWIRNNQYYDLVIDFESFVEDKSHPGYLYTAYDCGDGLHLSSIGGQAIAKEFPLVVFHSGNKMH